MSGRKVEVKKAEPRSALSASHNIIGLDRYSRGAADYFVPDAYFEREERIHDNLSGFSNRYKNIFYS